VLLYLNIGTINEGYSNWRRKQSHLLTTVQPITKENGIMGKAERTRIPGALGKLFELFG